MNEPSPDVAAAHQDDAALAARVRGATPARVFTGRAGTSYRTDTALALRAAHAAAQDAVGSPLDVSPPALRALVGARPVTVAATAAASPAEYLLRPDLGRRLSSTGRQQVQALTPGADLQLVLGDGLSARALQEQAPALVELLIEGAHARHWKIGDLVVLRHCRVGVMNDIGELLDPLVVVLLIGERPGLATPASLSAYLAYRPRAGDTDAQRNLVSNVDPRGLGPTAAAQRVLELADAMRAAGTSGVSIKETAGYALPTSADGTSGRC